MSNRWIVRHVGRLLETHCKHHRWKEPSMFASWQLMDWGGNADHYLEHFALISILFTLFSDGFLILRIPGIEGCSFSRLLGTHNFHKLGHSIHICVTPFTSPALLAPPMRFFDPINSVGFQFNIFLLCMLKAPPKPPRQGGLRPRWIRATTNVGEMFCLKRFWSWVYPSPFQGKRLAESQIRTTKMTRLDIK